MIRKHALTLTVVGACIVSAGVLAGATLYAGGKSRVRSGQAVAAPPMIAGTTCKPNSLFYYFDLQDGPAFPGQINFNIGVQLWVGPRMPLTVEEKSPFLRVEVYRPGDTNCRTEPLIRRDSPSVTMAPGQLYKEVVPFHAAITPHKDPYVVVIRLLNPTPDGGETKHVMERISYQVTRNEPTQIPPR